VVVEGQLPVVVGVEGHLVWVSLFVVVVGEDLDHLALLFDMMVVEDHLVPFHVKILGVLAEVHLAVFFVLVVGAN
jgi:hypothetical protein